MHQRLFVILILAAPLSFGGCKDTRLDMNAQSPTSSNGTSNSETVAERPIVFQWAVFSVTKNEIDPSSSVQIEHVTSEQVVNAFSKVDWAHPDLRPHFEIHRSRNGFGTSLLLRRTPNAEGVFEVLLTGRIGAKRVHAEKRSLTPIENPSALFEGFLNETDLSPMLQWDEFLLFDK